MNFNVESKGMPVQKLPFISFVVPTLNSQRTLDLCLSSIKNQHYRGRTEIVLADGGSTDNTLKIAQNYGARIVKNKLKTGEAGKAVGAKNAKGTILGFVDSDNVLPDDNWLIKMTEPFFENSDVIATEPLYFTYRKADHWLTRYFALLGMGDPLSLFIGNYDRYSFISDRWTELAIKTEDKKNWILLSLEKDNMPTIGANGFFIKKSELAKYPVKNYLFDIDVLKFLAKRSPVKVAKVKVGIIHLFTGSISTFIRKQRRRIRDFLYYQKSGIRESENGKTLVFIGVAKFCLASVLIIPLMVQTLYGYHRKKDIAWAFHPIACWLTLYAYTLETITSIFSTKEFSRKNWSQ